MAQALTFNQIVRILEDIATRNEFINSFFLGRDWELAQSNAPSYPLLQVYPINAEMPEGSKNSYNEIIFRMNIKVVDLVMQDQANQKSVHNSTLAIAQSIVNELNANPYFVRSNTQIIGSILFENMEEYIDDYLAGWQFELRIKVRNINSWCGQAFEPIDGFSISGPISSGYSPSVQYLTCATITGCTTLQDYVSIYGGGGAQNYYTTGATLIGTTAIFNRNDLTNAYELELSGLTSGITVSGNYLPISGGTVTGNTNFTAQLLSGGTDLYDIFSTSDIFTTGATLIGTVARFYRNDGLAYLLELSGLTSGITATGAYLNLSGGTVTGNTTVQANLTITGITESGTFKVTTFNPTNPQIYCDADTNTGLMFDGPDIMSLHTGGYQRLLINSSGQITNGSQLAGTGWETYLSGDTRLDLISATTLSATTSWVYNDPWTIELINGTTVDFYAPYAMAINSNTNILGSPTISLKDDDVAYTLGTTIAIGSKISVSGSTTGVTILNAIRL